MHKRQERFQKQEEVELYLLDETKKNIPIMDEDDEDNKNEINEIIKTNNNLKEEDESNLKSVFTLKKFRFYDFLYNK